MIITLGPTNGNTIPTTSLGSSNRHSVTWSFIFNGMFCCCCCCCVILNPLQANLSSISNSTWLMQRFHEIRAFQGKETSNMHNNWGEYPQRHTGASPDSGKKKLAARGNCICFVLNIFPSAGKPGLSLYFISTLLISGRITARNDRRAVMRRARYTAKRGFRKLNQSANRVPISFNML